jgi:hypothetical protein
VSDTHKTNTYDYIKLGSVSIYYIQRKKRTYNIERSSIGSVGFHERPEMLKELRTSINRTRRRRRTVFLYKNKIEA